jgi:hypothetical protein
MPSETPVPSRVPSYDLRSLAAAALCVASLFFDAMGWLMALVGVVLLRRAAFSPRVKWMLAAITAAAVLLLWLADGFHRIEDAGEGRWALRHGDRDPMTIRGASTRP